MGEKGAPAEGAPFFLWIMPVKIAEIAQWMEGRFPGRWAESWDHVGLQLGSPGKTIQRIGISLEAVPRTIDWAVRQGIQLLICHHPLFFQPLYSLTGEGEPGRSAVRLIREEIALWVAHTNLDAAPEGVSTALARRMGLVDLTPLVPKPNEMVKVVVFVPIGYEERILEGIRGTRAGRIGTYSLCTFKARGEGTFLAEAESRPFIGEIGVLERASEWRLEILCPRNEIFRLLDRIRALHPYEEMAYDLYPLENPSPDTGLGRVGRFDPPLPGEELIRLLRERVEAPQLRLSGPLPDHIQRAAVCGGSGASSAGLCAWGSAT